MLVVSRIANPYYGEIAAAAIQAARARDYQLDVAEAGSADEEAAALANLRSGRVDGVVVATARPAGHGDQQHALRATARQELSRCGLPIVALLDNSPDPAIPAIRIDDAEGAYLATRHLLQLGHRRIGHVSYGTLPPAPDEIAASADRFKGHVRALAEQGLAPHPARLFGNASGMDGGLAAARHWYEQPAPRPTAVFVATDRAAIGLIRGFHELGVQVPEDVAIVGFDGVQAGQFSIPALTTIEHPRSELGRIGVDTLLDAIEEPADRRTAALGERVLPVRLVVRESCGASQLRAALDRPERFPNTHDEEGVLLNPR